MKHIRLLLLFIPYFLIAEAFIGITNAQSTSVQFRVNMNYFIEMEIFNPSSETIDIAGSFNGWGSSLTPMIDTQNDGIYSATISLNIGTTVEFKCRINGQWNGREEFPNGGPNRTYQVVENGIVEFWYNDEISPNVLGVRISSSTVFAKPGQEVRFSDQSSGNPIYRSWIFPGGNPSSSSLTNPVVTYSNYGAYDVTLSITDESNETKSKTFSNYVRVDEMQTYWWNDAVFYEVFVRSFKDSNGNGKGDLQGLIQKLDYLNDGDPSTTSDLGITGIWLMPIQESPSYHGYDATDYRKVEQDYGTNDDFKRLIQEAHKRGIRVIIDFVMNHTSNQHSWFVQSTNASSPMRDWYIWQSTNPGITGPWGQNVWHYRNGNYYYGLFWSGMPDLNFNNPDVKVEMFDIARFWLEEMNVDGFRLDAVKYIYEDQNSLENTPQTIEFWKEFRSFYKSINQEALSVGEAWASTEIASRYVNNNSLDYCFEFELADAIINAVNSGNASNLQLRIGNVMRAYPYLQFGTFLTNHDINRLMSILGYDLSKSKLAASLLLTLPGIPYIYYGEEIGMTGVKPDENIRTPMQWDSSTHSGFTSGTPWRAVNSDFPSKNVSLQQNDPSSLWNHYKRLISIRNNEASLRRGNYLPVNTSSSSVVAFIRQYEGENVLVISNVGSETISNLTVLSTLAGISEGTYTVKNLNGLEEILVSVDDKGELKSFVIDVVSARSTGIYKFQGGQVSIETHQDPFSVNVFPVPAKDVLNVKISGNVFGDLTYRVVDLMGREVLSSKKSYGNANHIQIPTSSLPKGFYLLLININHDVNAYKFIVK